MSADRDRAVLGTWALALRVAGIALLLGMLTGSEGFVQLRANGRTDISFGDAVMLHLPYWLLWAALAGVVVEMVRRVPPAGPARPSRFLFHVALAAGLMLAHSAALYAVQRGLGQTDFLVPLWHGALAIARWRLAPNLVAYGAILGFVIASDASRSARDRERRATELAAQLAHAQLRALRMQLDPHFLFNALNAASMLVRRGRGEQAVEMIAGLGTLLRRTLEAGDAPEVSLRDELALLRHYLDVEQVRFGDRLRVLLDAAPETLDARVPSLVLQPVVENALRHGIERRSEAGTVRITSRRARASEGEADRLVLRVEDDGAGIDGAEGIRPGGLGIANTVERLARLYGDASDFDLRNGAVGAVATITLPFNVPGVPAGAAS